MAEPASTYSANVYGASAVVLRRAGIACARSARRVWLALPSAFRGLHELPFRSVKRGWRRFT
jgi:hypothetical protein